VSVSHVTCMNVQFKRGVAVSHVASLFGESCRTHCWVMSHTLLSHVAHIVESCRTHCWVMSHTWARHVCQWVMLCVCMKSLRAGCRPARCQFTLWVMSHTLSCHICQGVMWMRQVLRVQGHDTHMNHVARKNGSWYTHEPCHTSEWVMAQTWATSHIRMSHGTHMSHVTHNNESRPTDELIETWLILMCDVAHEFIETWLILMRDVAHEFIETWLILMCDVAHEYIEMWLIFMCDVAHECIQTWLILMCDDEFIKTWLILVTSHRPLTQEWVMSQSCTHVYGRLYNMLTGSFKYVLIFLFLFCCGRQWMVTSFFSPFVRPTNVKHAVVRYDFRSEFIGHVTHTNESRLTYKFTFEVHKCATCGRLMHSLTNEFIGHVTHTNESFRCVSWRIFYVWRKPKNMQHATVGYTLTN